MGASAEQLKAERIAAVVELVRLRVAPAEHAMVETIAREYYEQADPEDVAARAVEDLYGAVLSHWQFAHRRAAGQPRLRVLSPTVAEHGWSSRHTIVEIVNDDMPFLVDSATMEVNRQGLTLHQIVHPIFAVERDAGGVVTAIGSRHDAGGAPRESFMHVEVDRLVDPAQRARLAAGIERVLGDVRAVVQDWPAMLERLRAIAAEIDRAPPPLAADEIAEGRAFIEWLADEHLLLLGYRMHDLATEDGEDVLRLVPGTGLGILRESGLARISASFSALPSQARSIARAPTLIVMTKANARSTVHRPGHIDYVGIKRFAPDGTVLGEHRFLGLLTSTAYSARVAEVPLVRRKVEAVMARAQLAPGGHLDKALAHILETYPRDELFQSSPDELFDTALGILRLGQRQRLRLFVRRDPFERFVVCLIFVPRESYSTEMRHRFVAILQEAFAGTGSDNDVLLTDAVLARVQVTVRTTPGAVPVIDRRELEQRLAAAARRWEDNLREALIEAEGEARGLALFKRFGAAFPAAYRDQEPPRIAVADARKLATVAGRGGLGIALYRPLERRAGTLGFKIYHAGGPIVLSDSLRLLEHMGVRVLEEHPYELKFEGEAPLWIHDFLVQPEAAEEIEVETLAPLVEDTFARVLRGEVENDDFNRLAIGAGMAADEVVVLRAYAKYLRQIGFALSQSFIEATLAAHGPVARMLINLFKLRFDPDAADAAAAERQEHALEQALEKVANLNEDRVLRGLLGLVLATLRTNAWRTDAAGRRRRFLSFKFDCARVPGLPEPRPLYEIFVYAPRFEGIHLRGGRVARGGLRWSDRPEDFRTEVLGLLKAQMVKNTVIVPVGSKGGFVLKKAPPPADRDAFMKEGVACYEDFLRGLLDLTDNLAAGQVVPPPQVRRLDGDDPYLVVAADKGTATFSDFANGIAAEYGFWLGDAFASGGSVGYDHKAMGITARGAWEAVKRHFREMGVNTQTTPFTVAGIGDMSGDVFGNGMLLSPHIRLVAAFDHRHIFIDPDPDTEAGFAERRRLFDLPRSSWADYRAELISAGGGVWPRSAKKIAISPQARAVLGIEAEALAPNELVAAILRAPVDLLYNGGIGTYVKAGTETHADVGDRANDAVRVNGSQLRCKVVAEGGNLGFTQLGRIEYALAGGRINTDAIDNSAGVDTSDHEVNIKILLGLAVADGELTDKQRNQLLAAMTGEVAALVLRDNVFQTQALSLAGRLGPKLLDQQIRLMRFLERGGRLNRALEFLPGEEELAERRARGIGLANPERAVLLAYAKIWLYDELVGTGLPDDPWVATALARYFPARLRERFAELMPRHPLRREIIATHVVNSMINRVGSTFVHRMTEATGAGAAQVVRAYLLARETFGLVPLWEAIEALDGAVPDATQAELPIELGRLIVRATTWFLRSRRLDDPMAETIARFAPAAGVMIERQAAAPLAARWSAAGVPEALARQVAATDAAWAALDVAEIALRAARSIADVADVYLHLGELLGLARLRRLIDALPSDGHWQALAKAAAGDDLAGLQRTLATNAVPLGDDAATALAVWQRDNGAALDRARRLLDELAEAKGADLAMLSVALRELRNLV